jgi:hypothetical protein
MDKPEHFEILKTHAVCRLAGEVTLEKMELLVTAAITYAREQNVRRLLLDATGITGFKPMSITERYLRIQKWAIAADMSIRIAAVVKTEMIDPQKIGVSFARNFGLLADIFDSETEALAWLLSDQ